MNIDSSDEIISTPEEDERMDTQSKNYEIPSPLSTESTLYHSIATGGTPGIINTSPSASSYALPTQSKTHSPNIGRMDTQSERQNYRKTESGNLLSAPEDEMAEYIWSCTDIRNRTSDHAQDLFKQRLAKKAQKVLEKTNLPSGEAVSAQQTTPYTSCLPSEHRTSMSNSGLMRERLRADKGYAKRPRLKGNTRM